MFRGKYQRKSGLTRALVALLALVMLASVCFPAMRVSAEEQATASVTVTVGETKTYLAEIPEGASVSDIVVPEESGLTVTYPDLQFAVDATKAIAGTYIVTYTYLDAENTKQDGSFTVAVVTAAPLDDESNDDDETKLSVKAQEYFNQIAQLKKQISELDDSSEDYEEQFEQLFYALEAVKYEAGDSWENDEITEEEMESICIAVNTAIVELGYDPYQATNLGLTARIVNSNSTMYLTIHFVDDSGNSLSSTNSGNYTVNRQTSLATIAASYPVTGYNYSYAYYKSGTGSTQVLNDISSGKRNWSVNNGTENLSNGSDIYLVYTNSTSPEPEDKVRVYVYVAGNKWVNNIEFQDLIKLYACDTNGYFPAGEIELDASYFTGKNYNTVGAPLITNASDWTALLAALGQMDTSNLDGTNGVEWSGNGTLNFNANKENLVEDYLSQAVEAYNASMGSQTTALFRWNDSTSYGFADQSVKYHLDLAFNTKTITFVTGNNGITNSSAGDAVDGTVVDTRTYITGSLIQDPKTLNVPTGYKVVGYFLDIDLKTPWNGIGTPLNEDQTVYIKIVLDDTIETDPGTLKITGEKYWVGDEGTGLRPDSITVQLQGSTDGIDWVNLGEALTVQVNPDGKWTYSFDVSSYAYTRFRVRETPVANYEASYADPEVTFTYPSADAWSSKVSECSTVTFTEETNKSTIIVAKKGNAYYVWTYDALTPGVQELIIESIKDFGEGNNNSTFTFFYGYGATTHGITVSENQLDFANPSEWSYYFSGRYTKASAEATKSTITNTLSTGTVTITKQVKGNMGDASKVFPFEVTLTGGSMPSGAVAKTDKSVAYEVSSDGTKITFSLKDKESVILQNVPLSATLLITEKNTGAYTVKIGDTVLTKDTDGNASDLNGITVTSGMGDIIVINENDANIDTGITMDSVPYVVLLAMAVIGGGELLSKRRVY